MAHNYSTLFKLPTTGLRFFTVYGPWAGLTWRYSYSRKPSLRAGNRGIQPRAPHARLYLRRGYRRRVVRVSDRVPKPDLPLGRRQSRSRILALRRIDCITSAANRPIELLRYIEVLEDWSGAAKPRNHEAAATWGRPRYLRERR